MFLPLPPLPCHSRWLLPYCVCNYQLISPLIESFITTNPMSSNGNTFDPPGPSDTDISNSPSRQPDRRSSESSRVDNSSQPGSDCGFGVISIDNSAAFNHTILPPARNKNQAAPRKMATEKEANKASTERSLAGEDGVHKALAVRGDVVGPALAEKATLSSRGSGLGEHHTCSADPEGQGPSHEPKVSTKLDRYGYSIQLALLTWETSDYS